MNTNTWFANAFDDEEPTEKRESAPKSVKKFNINDVVLVKLTEEGHAILKKRHEDFIKSLLLMTRDSQVDKVKEKYPYIPPKVDSDGYSKFQFWVLMETFGRAMELSNSKLPFETTVFLEE